MARDFDGTDDIAKYTTSAPLSAFPCSLAAWVLPDSGSLVAAILGCWNTATDANTNQLCLQYIGSIPEVRMQMAQGGSSAYAYAGVTLSTTVPSLVVGVALGPLLTDVTVYVNGTAYTTRNGVNVGSFPSVNSVAVGGKTSTDSIYWDGDIAEAAIWSAGLTQADVDQLTDRFSSEMVRPGALEFYSRLTGRHSPEIDRVGGRNLTLTGTAYADHPRMFYPRGVEQIHVPAAAAGGRTTKNTRANPLGFAAGHPRRLGTAA